MRRIAFLFFAGALFSAADSLRAEVTTTGDVDPGGAATQPDPWAIGGDLRVGDSGVGTLHIESGGAVTDSDGYVGWHSGSTGEVTVTGADSQWTNINSLAVGLFGTGTLNIESAGTVTNSYGNIGKYSSSTGEVTVTGTDSQWINSRTLRVGELGFRHAEHRVGGRGHQSARCHRLFLLLDG